MGKNQHVVMHDDRWAVKEEGAATPIATFKTQGQAWEKATALRPENEQARRNLERLAAEKPRE